MSDQSVIQTVLDKINGVEPPRAGYTDTLNIERRAKAKSKATALTEEQLTEIKALRSKLSVGRWIVEFIKADGSHRVMECTLDSRLIPNTEANVKEQVEKAVSAAVRVFDLEKGEWRSFRFDSLQKEPYKLGEAQ
jgi:hypothetical protein